MLCGLLLIDLSICECKKKIFIGKIKITQALQELINEVSVLDKSDIYDTCFKYSNEDFVEIMLYFLSRAS